MGLAKLVALLMVLLLAGSSFICLFIYIFYKMKSPTNWEFFKKDEDKILWVHISTKDLTGIAISLNKWWKTRYPEYKMRVVSKKEFEQLKKNY